MQYDLPIYTTAKAIKYIRAIHDTSQWKSIQAYDNKIHISMTSQIQV